MPADQPSFQSYSANNEDVILNRVFAAQREGFFVDVGAAHPMFENDTRALYERGWHGINIEPNLSFYQNLVDERPRDTNLNLAVSDISGDLTFHEVVGTGLSTCDGEDAERAAAKGFEVIRHVVPAKPLRDILPFAAPPVIDLLKVDVEGFELKVMQSNDWKRFRPKLVMAEATYPESPIRRDNGVSEYLASQGYRAVYFDGLNDFYAERDFAPPAEAFDRPPNVFDHYVPFAQHELARANAGLARQIEGLTQERENALAYAESAKAEMLAYAESAKAEMLAYAESVKTEMARGAKAYRHAALVVESQTIDLANTRDELIGMRERCKMLTGDMEAMAQRHQHEIDGLTSRLSSLYASSSWRVTRPLRLAARPRRTWRILMGRLSK